jgi:hypothetical protein
VPNVEQFRRWAHREHGWRRQGESGAGSRAAGAPTGGDPTSRAETSFRKASTLTAAATATNRLWRDPAPLSTSCTDVRQSLEQAQRPARRSLDPGADER